MKHRHFPRYIDDADFTTNAPSYYEDLARKEKLIRLLAERIWGYETILDDTLEEIQERFRAWDKNLEDFPDDVNNKLQIWLQNGALDHIINDTIFNWKLDTEIFENFLDVNTVQLQHKATKGDIGLIDLDKNKTQFDETWFADSVKQQWTGTTPVNATPPDGGVTTVKLAPKAVTKDKMSITPVSGTHTSNLYDRRKAVKGIYYESGQGSEQVNSNYEAIKLIEVEPNTTYIVSHRNQIVMRDKDTWFVDGKNLDILGVDTFTTTATTRYVSVSIPHNVSHVYQLQKGTTLSPYEPYGVKNTDILLGTLTPNDFIAYVNGLISQGSPKKTLQSTIARVIKDKLKVKLLGDSITAGLGGTGYDQDGQYIFSGYNVNENGYCWANEFRDYMAEKFSVTVKNFGCSGITTRHIKSGFEYLVENDDDVVFVMIGTNNRGLTGSSLTEYRNDLIEIGNRIRNLGKEVIFISSLEASLVNESQETMLFHMEDVNNTVMEVSENIFNQEHISFYNEVMKYCTFTNTPVSTILADGLHPNDEGYKVMFEIFLNMLGLGLKIDGATW